MHVLIIMLGTAFIFLENQDQNQLFTDLSTNKCCQHFLHKSSDDVQNCMESPIKVLYNSFGESFFQSVIFYN
jgi:hypothetical protein